MKKSILLLTWILLIFGIAGCTSENVSNIESEFRRIDELIPSEFSDDLVLPFSDVVDIHYYVNDIEKTVLLYELLPNDKAIILEVRITEAKREETYYISTKQLGDSELYEQQLLGETHSDILAKIDSYLPDFMESNYDVPPTNILETDVSYEIDCTDIVRDRFVYTYPSADTECIVSATFVIDSEVIVEDYPIIMRSLNSVTKIPEIFITTDNSQEINSKDDFVTGSLTLKLNDYTHLKALTNVPVSIRLRGNSTITMPKKAYKIKFDEKQRFLSQYSEKDWVLIANYVDHTLIRNTLAYSLAGKLNLGFTPQYIFADVYINGAYQGNYLITDQIEVTNDRVNIEENVAKVDTGYLVELDWGLYREGLENTDDNYFLIDGAPFVIHSPDYEDEHYMNEQYEFISDYFELVLDTLEAKDDYSDLIDEETFIDWYIVNELFKNVDAGYSSVYFNKDSGGLLKMGPVWDFDLSTGNPGYLPERGPEGWYVGNQNKNIFFYHLLQYPEFEEHLKDRWNEIYRTKIITLLPQVHRFADSITYSRYRNFLVWDVIGIDINWYTAPEIYDLKTYDEQVWFLYDYLDQRIEWMNEEFNK